MLSGNRGALHSIRSERGFLIQHGRLGVLHSVGRKISVSTFSKKKTVGSSFSIVKTEEIRIHDMTSISTGLSLFMRFLEISDLPEEWLNTLSTIRDCPYNCYGGRE